MKLDARTVAEAALPRGQADVIFFDDDLPGYGLRIRAGGNRSYIAQYRGPDGRSRRVTIGAAAKLTPTDARQAARKILARAALGHDPQGEKAAQRRQAARTVRVLVAAYLEAKQAELRPESFRTTKLYLTGPYFQSLQALGVTAVARSDVAGAIRAIVRNHSTASAARPDVRCRHSLLGASPRGSWATVLILSMARIARPIRSRAIGCFSIPRWPRSGAHVRTAHPARSSGF